MVVVKADGYGHGMVPVARAAREAGAEWLGVATGDEALALREAGDTGPLLCWLAAPGADFAPLLEADVDVTAYGARPARRHRPRRPRGRPPGAAAAQVRHRPLPRRGASRGVAGAGDRRPAARRRTAPSGSPGCGPTSPAPTSPTTPPTPPRRPPSTRRWRWRSTPVWSPRCATSPTPPARCCTRDARLRPGPAAASPSTASAPRPTCVTSERARPGAGDDGARHGRARQGARGRRRRLLRPHLRGARSRCGSRWCRWGTATASRATRPRRAEVLVDGMRGRVLGRICMDQFVVEAPEAHGRRRGACCSVPGTQGEPTATDWARVVRHDQLRDRHPDGRPPGPPLGRRRRRAAGGRASMSKRSLAYAAGGLGAAAVAALATGVVVERRVVKARRAGAAAGRPARHAALRPGRPQRPTTGCGCTPRSTRSRRTPGRQASPPRGRDAGLRARLRAEPRLLALPARGLPRQAPDGVLRPALARPLGAVSDREHATIDQLGDDLARRRSRQLAPRGPTWC